MDTKVVSREFERRFQNACGVHVAEKCGKHAPITLESELWNALAALTPFAAVITDWTLQHGMITALKIASPLICMQVSRFGGMDHTEHRLFDFGQHTFNMDVFTDASSLRLAKVQVGGCCDLLRQFLERSLSECIQGKWMLQNDNVPPSARDSLPQWFDCRISHVWLVRSDQMRQLSVPLNGPNETQAAMAELQALLKA